MEIQSNALFSHTCGEETMTRKILWLSSISYSWERPVDGPDDGESTDSIEAVWWHSFQFESHSEEMRELS